MSFVFKKMAKNDQESITQAANASMQMIDKLNNERFKKMNQIVVSFQWTTFYHIGGDPVNSCTPCLSFGRAVDPRFVCEAKASEQDQGYLDWIRFVLDYKLWQRIPVYDPNSKDTVSGDKCEWYPESFNSILEWLVADLAFQDSKIEFRGDTGLEKWSSIMASLYYFDKLNTFKQYAVDVWEFAKERIDIICGLSSDAEYLIDRQYFDTATNKITRLFGVSREEAIKSNLGIFIPVASYCSSALKDEYKSIKAEYDKAVEDIKQILATSAALTLCWNNATVGSNYLSQIGDNTDSIVNAGHDIKQVLNCAGEQLKTEVDDMSDPELMQFMQANRRLIQNNTSTINNIAADIEAKMAKNAKTTKTVLGVIIAAIFVLFIMTLFFGMRRSMYGGDYYYDDL